MEKKAILFVDDEPNILSGIKRMLRSLRSEFDFYFAESGNAALAIMEETPIDIVVSDMRMPVMDGVQFLTKVKEGYPYVVRIMLTGQADDDSVLKTVSIVHQFLSKPCDSEHLKDVLMRSRALLDQVNNDRLKNIIAGIDSLPSLPTVFAKLQDVLNDPEATADQVAEVIEQDIAMTAKLLQLVNSSFFGLFQKVESPARAVKLLGLDTVKILVLGVQIFSEIQIDNKLISLDDLWEHSMSVAHCSKKIALDATEDVGLVNNCFIAGMLHDIGRLLLISCLSDEYGTLVNKARDEDASLIELESREMLSTHADIGAYLIGLWGFCGDIIEAIAFHNSIGSYPATTFTAALAVHIADACYYVRHPAQAVGKPPVLDDAYLDELGFGEKKEQWCELCDEVLEKIEGGD